MTRDTKDVLAAVGALRIAVDLLAEQGIPLMQLLELVQGIWDVRNPQIGGKERLRGAVHDALTVAGFEHAHQVASAVAYGLTVEAQAERALVDLSRAVIKGSQRG